MMTVVWCHWDKQLCKTDAGYQTFDVVQLGLLLESTSDLNIKFRPPWPYNLPSCLQLHHMWNIFKVRSAWF